MYREFHHPQYFTYQLANKISISHQDRKKNNDQRWMKIMLHIVGWLGNGSNNNNGDRTISHHDTLPRSVTTRQHKDKLLQEEPIKSVSTNKHRSIYLRNASPQGAHPPRTLHSPIRQINKYQFVPPVTFWPCVYLFKTVWFEHTWNYIAKLQAKQKLRIPSSRRYYTY